jgi:hypothetical protein
MIFKQKPFRQITSKKGRPKMKKIFGFATALLIFLSSLAFAGGDQNCGDKATGPAGSTGSGDVTQRQTPGN